MSMIFRLTGSFLLGVCLFLTLVLFLPLQRLASNPNPQLESEQVISGTALAGYPKHLDAFYFNLASLCVPVFSFAVWKILEKRSKVRPMMIWMPGMFWIAILAARALQIWNQLP